MAEYTAQFQLGNKGLESSFQAVDDKEARDIADKYAEGLASIKKGYTCKVLAVWQGDRMLILK
ncbi:MAG: hypothetical protein V4690_02740 [Patescibacteria group bacterium]